jgi:hypothetical protein
MTIVSSPLLVVGFTTELAPAGDWRVVHAPDAEAALDELASGVGLILIRSGDNMRSAVAAIRTSGLAAGHVPIAVWGDAKAWDPGGPALPDLYIPEEPAGGFSAALTPWLPRALPEAYDRLETAFGVDTVRNMARRLCQVLADALDALNTPAAADAAHKVAGVAGTLGFAELGSQWLALSHDSSAEPPTLRRDTRTTIAAIVLRTEAETRV